MSFLSPSRFWTWNLHIGDRLDIGWRSGDVSVYHLLRLERRASITSCTHSLAYNESMEISSWGLTPQIHRIIDLSFRWSRCKSGTVGAHVSLHEEEQSGHMRQTPSHELWWICSWMLYVQGVQEKTGNLYKICQISNFCQYCLVKSTWSSTYGFSPYTVQFFYKYSVVLKILSNLGLQSKSLFNMISIFLHSTRTVFEPLSLHIGLIFNQYWHPYRNQNAHIIKLILTCKRNFAETCKYNICTYVHIYIWIGR